MAGDGGSDPTVSVLIVSWNTRDVLAGCLEALARHAPHVPHDVWVVDNASSDGSQELVRRRFPQVHLIANDDNVGFAAANNQAAASSAGRWLLLLNSDTEVRAGAVDALVREMEVEASVGIVGARLLNPDGTLQYSCQRAPSPWREAVHLWHLDRVLPGPYYPMGRWPLDRARDVDVVQGACLLARRDAYEDGGRLDSGYFMYSEEIELCERARAQGWRVRWVPQAEVVHYGGASTAAAPDEMFLQLYASKVRFYRRNRGTRHAAAFKAVLAVSALPRVAAGAMAGLAPADRRSGLRDTSRRYRRLLASLPGL